MIFSEYVAECVSACVEGRSIVRSCFSVSETVPYGSTICCAWACVGGRRIVRSVFSVMSEALSAVRGLVQHVSTICSGCAWACVSSRRITRSFLCGLSENYPCVR